MRITLIVLFLCNFCLGSDLKPDLDTFNNKIKPLLEKYCIDCHGPKKVKGKMRFDDIDPNIINGEDSGEWEDTLEAFNTGEMPPEDEPQPTAAEREIFSLWMDQEFKKARLFGNPNKKGSVRRLTRYEIKYSLEDLLGISVGNEIENLPGESPSAETGLKNSSRLLMVSSSHLESYFNAIFAVFDKIKKSLNYKRYSTELDMVGFVIPEPKNLYSEDNVKTKPEDIQNKKKKKKAKVKKETPPFVKVEKADGGLWIQPGGHASLAFPYIPKALYKISFEAKSVAEGYVDLSMGFKYSATDRREFKQSLGSLTLVGGNELSLYKMERDPGDLPHTITRSLDREYFIRLTNKSKKPIFVASFKYTGNINDHVKAALMDPALDPQDSEGIITAFATKALRRQLTAREKDHYLKLYKGFSQDMSETEALLSTYEELLCLPEFFYTGVPGEMNEEQKRNFLLAEKLSYFLWCSIPDKLLLQDAAAGRLTDSLVLEKHIDRMLKDPRSRRLVENFTDQWLHTSTLFNVAVDNLYYKGFKDTIKVDMHQETIESVNDVIRNNAPATDLLKADHVFVNGTLAKYYGIKGVNGPDFRKVPLKDDSPRGGLLTQGTFLIGNSDGMNSHAILRGVWLTEIILNDPPPEPPKNVPPLDESIPGFDKMTLNQKLFIHRNNDACRSCHNKIDPWGILFENFDASGRWREKVLVVSKEQVKGKKKAVVNKSYLPVENEATVPSKDRLKGTGDLKEYLLSKKADGFAEGFVEKLLSYALSRDVDFYDADLVTALNSKFMNADFSTSVLIREIVKSDEFFKGGEQ